jgi:hypothetical protein
MKKIFFTVCCLVAGGVFAGNITLYWSGWVPNGCSPAPQKSYSGGPWLTLNSPSYTIVDGSDGSTYSCSEVVLDVPGAWATRWTVTGTPLPLTNMLVLAGAAITNRVSFQFENPFMFDMDVVVTFYDEDGEVISVEPLGSAPGAEWDSETFTSTPGSAWVFADQVPFPEGAFRMAIAGVPPNAAIAGLLGAFGYSEGGYVGLGISDVSWSAALNTGGAAVEETEAVSWITLNESQSLEDTVDTTVSSSVGPTTARSASTTVQITCGPPASAVSAVNSVITAAGGSSSSAALSNFAGSATAAAVGSAVGSAATGGGGDLSGVIGAVNSVGAKVDAVGEKIDGLTGDFTGDTSGMDDFTTALDDSLLSDTTAGVSAAENTRGNFISAIQEGFAINFPTITGRIYEWNLDVGPYHIKIDLNSYKTIIEGFRMLCGWFLTLTFIIFMQSVVRKGIA